MQLCWFQDPNKRPTFTEIVKKCDGVLPDMEAAQESIKQKGSTCKKHNMICDSPSDVTANHSDFVSDSLFANIIEHLQQTPPQSFQLADTFLFGKDTEYTFMQPVQPKGIVYENFQLQVESEEPFQDCNHEYDATPDHMITSDNSVTIFSNPTNDRVMSSDDHMICTQTSQVRQDSSPTTEYVTMYPGPTSPIKA